MGYTPSPMDYIRQSGDLAGATSGYTMFSQSTDYQGMLSNNAKDQQLSQLITMTYNNRKSKSGLLSSLTEDEANRILDYSYSSQRYGATIRNYLLEQLSLQASKGLGNQSKAANKILTQWMYKVAPETAPAAIALQAQLIKPKTEAEISQIAAQDLDRILGNSNPLTKTLGLPAGVSNDIDERRQLVLRGITKHFAGIQPSSIQPVSAIPGPELRGN